MITINDRRGHDEFDNWGEHSVCENVCTGGKSRGGCLIQILLGAWFSNIWCMQKSLGNFYNKLLIADNKKFQNAAARAWGHRNTNLQECPWSLYDALLQNGSQTSGECLPILPMLSNVSPRNFVDVDSNVVFSCQRCNDVTALEDVKTSKWSWLWDIPLCEY